MKASETRSLTGSAPDDVLATLYRDGMTAQTDAWRTEALALPEAERAPLAVEVLGSLDDQPVETDQAEAAPAT